MTMSGKIENVIPDDYNYQGHMNAISDIHKEGLLIMTEESVILQEENLEVLSDFHLS